jgi:hypothetical protein
VEIFYEVFFMCWKVSAWQWYKRLVLGAFFAVGMTVSRFNMKRICCCNGALEFLARRSSDIMILEIMFTFLNGNKEELGM